MNYQQATTPNIGMAVTPKDTLSINTLDKPISINFSEHNDNFMRNDDLLNKNTATPKTISSNSTTNSKNTKPKKRKAINLGTNQDDIDNSVEQKLDKPVDLIQNKPVISFAVSEIQVLKLKKKKKKKNRIYSDL